MLGTKESFIEAIERLREELRNAERRHQGLRDEFNEFKLQSILNSTALQNRPISI